VQENNVDEVLSDQGRLEEAEVLFRSMVRVSRAARFPIGAALGTGNLGRLASRAGRFADAHELIDEAAAAFALIDAGRYVNETHARRAECLVLEVGTRKRSRWLRRLSRVRARHRSAVWRGSSSGRIGLALHQARRPHEGTHHLFESLRIARELRAVYEEALTLRALTDTNTPDADAHRAEGDEILARLGLLFVPKAPLP